MFGGKERRRGNPKTYGKTKTKPEVIGHKLKVRRRGLYRELQKQSPPANGAGGDGQIPDRGETLGNRRRTFERRRYSALLLRFVIRLKDSWLCGL